jgi:hypothetical protein
MRDPEKMSIDPEGVVDSPKNSLMAFVSLGGNDRRVGLSRPQLCDR